MRCNAAILTVRYMREAEGSDRGVMVWFTCSCEAPLKGRSWGKVRRCPSTLECNWCRVTCTGVPVQFLVLAPPAASRALAMLALLLFVCCIMVSASVVAQTAIIDWSRVMVDESANAADFGPTVEVGEEQLNASAMVGYFANADGFYGRPAWTEYILLRWDALDDRLEALKIVGDANVPRGQLSFRTAPGHPLTERMAIQLQLRDNPNDPNGFEWSRGNHFISWATQLPGKPSSCYGAEQLEVSDYTAGDENETLRYFCSFLVIGPNPSSRSSARFFRVPERIAIEAALSFGDAT